MPAKKEFSRAERVGDQIQRELAQLITRELGDPRVGRVTLSGVVVSPDLRHAKVFFTPAGEADACEVAAGLNRAAGYLRRRLGAIVRLKYLPRLTFAYDPTLDNATRIDGLLEAALAPERTSRDASHDRAPEC